MTIKQKQHLLAYLGYYTMAVDGIWGSGSVNATKGFQADYDLEADGKFGPATEERIKEVIGGEEQPTDFWAGIPNFTKEEFRCKCGGKHCSGFPAEPDRLLVRTCQQIRTHFGASMTITSGVRCEAHNANVGGHPNSNHKNGRAADFRVQGVTAGALLAYVQSLEAVTYAYAIDGHHIHITVG